MRKVTQVLAAAILAATVGLAGCNWIEGETPAERITNAIVQGCSFKPDLSSVSAILAALGPEVSVTAAVVDQIANAVCASVGQPPAEGTFASAEETEPKSARIKVGDKEVVVRGNWVVSQ